MKHFKFIIFFFPFYFIILSHYFIISSLTFLFLPVSNILCLFIFAFS